MRRICRGMLIVLLLVPHLGMSAERLALTWPAGKLPCDPRCGAREVAGVTVPETITLPDDATSLVLNGAGVRSRFFLKIYVGALCLPSRETEVHAILDAAGPKSVRATFLYGLTVERVRYAWHQGFTRHLSEDEFEALRPRLRQFIDLLGPTKRGDIVHFDYRPAHGTEIWFNGERRGVIPGADFHRALLGLE